MSTKNILGTNVPLDDIKRLQKDKEILVSKEINKPSANNAKAIMQYISNIADVCESDELSNVLSRASEILGDNLDGSKVNPNDLKISKSIAKYVMDAKLVTGSKEDKMKESIKVIIGRMLKEGHSISVAKKFAKRIMEKQELEERGHADPVIKSKGGAQTLLRSIKANLSALTTSLGELTANASEFPNPKAVEIIGKKLKGEMARLSSEFQKLATVSETVSASGISTKLSENDDDYSADYDDIKDNINKFVGDLYGKFNNLKSDENGEYPNEEELGTNQGYLTEISEIVDEIDFSNYDESKESIETLINQIDIFVSKIIEYEEELEEEGNDPFNDSVLVDEIDSLMAEFKNYMKEISNTFDGSNIENDLSEILEELDAALESANLEDEEDFSEFETLLNTLEAEINKIKAGDEPNIGEIESTANEIYDLAMEIFNDVKTDEIEVLCNTAKDLVDYMEDLSGINESNEMSINSDELSEDDSELSPDEEKEIQGLMNWINK